MWYLPDLGPDSGHLKSTDDQFIVDCGLLWVTKDRLGCFFQIWPQRRLHFSAKFREAFDLEQALLAY